MSCTIGRQRNFPLCVNCTNNGFCMNQSISIVCNEKLNDPVYLTDLKDFARSLSVSDSHWQDHVADLYRDYSGWIRGVDGEEVFLDMAEFERPNIREWFRDFLRPIQAGTTPRVRREARERVRILATILSARYPFDAMLWGLEIANSNHRPVND